MGKIVIEDQEMTVEYSSPRYYWSIGDLTWRSLLGSVVNRRFVGAVVLCQNVLPQREIFEIMG